jgi:hypothetical protein
MLLFLFLQCSYLTGVSASWVDYKVIPVLSQSLAIVILNNKQRDYLKNNDIYLGIAEHCMGTHVPLSIVSYSGG